MNKLKVILIFIGLIILTVLLYPKEKTEPEIIKPPVLEEEEKGDTDSDRERIRVVLKNQEQTDIYHTAVHMIPDCPYEVMIDGKSYLHEAGEPYQLELNELKLEEGEQLKIHVIPLQNDAKTKMMSIQRHQGNPSYRGTFELQCVNKGIVVINDVMLEEYLYAVVPSEMPSDYPIEALKAQAICARTYAMKQMQYSKYAAIGAHLDDSTSYQVYHDIAEQENVNQAVDATKGKVVTYHGEVKDTYYFSTSCGYTTDGGSWKTDADEDMSYLESRRLSGEAVEAWNADETKPAEEKDFDTFIRACDTMDYESDEPWYRWEMQIECAALSAVDEKIRERYTVNPDKILTRMEDGSYKATEPPEIGELKSITAAERGDGGVIESLIIEGSHATIQILTEYNIRYILAAEGAPIKRIHGEAVSCGRLLPSAFFVFDTEYQDDKLKRLVLHGGGYGHGTGMSQNCAKKMAEQGMQAEEIVSYFYHDIEIHPVNDRI